MPIRTSRGRAAVYRRLWGWPLRSPAHLIAVLVVTVAVVTTIGLTVPRFVDSPGGPGAVGGGAPSYDYSIRQDDGDARSSSRDAAESWPTRLTSPARTPTSAPPAEGALRTARSWADAWADHSEGMTNAEWLNGLRPYTTAEYLPVMSSVDPANVPATRVTGDPEVRRSYTSSVEADVPTDGPVLRLTVIETDSGWRVADYEQGS